VILKSIISIQEDNLWLSSDFKGNVPAGIEK
jgi:hypothetical protein